MTPSILLSLLLVSSFQGRASASDFQVPALTGPVVDQANVISSGTKDDLQTYLRQLVERGGAQIQIATVRDLGGLTIEEASIQITDRWKLGKKKEDRGLLFLLAPTERKVRIEVGQGLEGTLPDVTANRIISEVIVPRLKEGSVDRAVLDGVSALVKYTDPTFIADLPKSDGPAAEATGPSGSGNWLGILLWLGIMLLFILPRFFSRGRGSGAGFVAGLLLGGMGGRSGNSGGGWSGGGGGFSGGGASGSW